ncbi:MAG: MoaD/ThiS family protein [Candidatus Dormibacteria bacterium]|jgi:molybdopterin converting factor subunit 1
MSTGTVRILLFATLRQVAGCSLAEVELPRQGGSVQWCWEALCREHPELSTHQGTVRPALNRSYVGWDEAVAGGDELAFIPPVSGGAV